MSHEMVERLRLLEQELAVLKSQLGAEGDARGIAGASRRSLLRHMAVGAAGVATATVVGAATAAAAAADGGGPSRRGSRRHADVAAEHEILDVLYAYGHALDYGGLETFLACFTEDADYVVTFRIEPARNFSFHGHEELTGYFNGHTHAPEAWHKHVTTNASITVDGWHATSTSYFLRVDAGAQPAPSQVVASGRYLDELVRDRWGNWRIASRIAEVENL